MEANQFDTEYNPLAKFEKNLLDLEQTKNLRSLPKSNIEGLINLSSNDYLGLNNDQDIQLEFRKTKEFKELSFSAGSTRLLTGNIHQYTMLEEHLARLFKSDSALIFNSGYHANMGILPALTDKRDLIIADKEVHASLIDAMQLSSCDTMRYRHSDLTHLERLLEKNQNKYENIFVATESIFSMDGLRTNLQKLVELKEKYRVFLYLDEAHAFGVCGEKGLGLAEEMNLLHHFDFIVGTFGKSLASLGAFVICNSVFKKYLVNKSRSLIYTTGLPPLNLAWTNFVLMQLPNMTDRRKHINTLWNQFSTRLGLKAESHVVPYVLGNNADVIEFAAYMQSRGFYVLPIRYPTVPKGTERIRFSFNAALPMKSLEPIFDSFYGYKKIT